MQLPRKVYLDFIGCRLNQAEIEEMGRQFASIGNEITTHLEEADLIVVNTCTVTKQAAKKSRQLIRQAARQNPNAQIVATGCYAEVSPDKLSQLTNVSQVIGTHEKDLLVPMVTDRPLYEQEPLERDPLPPGTIGRTRAFVKVQDGCDNACTFCITTVARGAGRSRPLTEVISEINLLDSMGYQEVVLTGVHLGSYGHDFTTPRDTDLYELVSAILRETDMSRIRLSSLEPWDLDENFFGLWEDPRLLPHLHLPLQAGCNTTLKRMRRNTTKQEFSRLAKMAFSAIPDLALTTDVIVGFPGETESDFIESLEYVGSMGFAGVHVFTYSRREGTPAARMKDHIRHDIKKMRTHQMLDLANQLAHAFRERYLGQTAEILWESASGATSDRLIWLGHTRNYLRARTVSSEDLTNQITRGKIRQLDGLEFQVNINVV